jgi:hypothetical protein
VLRHLCERFPRPSELGCTPTICQFRRVEFVIERRTRSAASLAPH